MNKDDFYSKLVEKHLAGEVDDSFLKGVADVVGYPILDPDIHAREVLDAFPQTREKEVVDKDGKDAKKRKKDIGCDKSNNRQRAISKKEIEIPSKYAKLNIDDPREIYSSVDVELNNIISELTEYSGDEQLNNAQRDACSLLQERQLILKEQLEALEENSEWDTFTMVFFGETGAGKSTIIETLRVLLKESSKLKDQEAFREFQNKHELTDERLSWLRREEDQLGREEQQFRHVETECESELSALNEDKSGRGSRLAETRSKLRTLRELLSELEKLSDGTIIGDGRSDFTKKTQRFDFSVAGKKFALLDAPGIEGTENLITEEIKKALQSAHAVFYVTDRSAPPQTGDQEGRKGTLQKIKMYLGASTEIWCVFNKKIPNPKYALKDHPLLSEDECTSLRELEEKMEEQLGSNFQGVLSLTALPAFLAATDHFAPNSQNAKRRKKALSEFESDQLIDLSGMEAFIRHIQDSLLEESHNKIHRANLFKVKEALDETAIDLDQTGEKISELAANLRLGEQSSKKEIRSGFSSFWKRIESAYETSIDRFSSNVLTKIYSKIDRDISNDTFNSNLKHLIKTHQKQLSDELEKFKEKEIERFKKETKSIVKRFENKNRELMDIYTTILSSDIDRAFDLKLDIDNGLRLTSLLATIGGAALLLVSGAHLAILAIGAVGIVISLYKAVREFFSSDYKKSQQRKAADQNLREVSKKMRDSMHKGFKKGMPEMEKVINEIEHALASHANKARNQADLISQSNKKIKTLSSMMNL